MLYASRFLRYREDFMRGPDVLGLQERLNELGYTISANGIYDHDTGQAVLRLQEAMGIPADGVVGPEIWNRLTLGKAHVVASENLAALPSILVNLNQRRMTFTLNGVSTIYPVAVGKPSTPSPLGNWVIVQKALNPGGPFGARWMRLSVPWGGYGIHGTNNPKSIGRAVSHGCIRLYNRDVIKIYDLTPIGTPVSIVGNIYSGNILKEGNTGADVKQLQKDLKKLGYYKSSIDGSFGPKTTIAVKAFQADQNISSDGIVGPYTYFTLQKALDIATNDIEP